MTRKIGKINPMKKRIILNSFCVVKFDVIIRQVPLSAMPGLLPMPVPPPPGYRPVAILLPAVLLETISYTWTDVFTAAGPMKQPVRLPPTP